MLLHLYTSREPAYAAVQRVRDLAVCLAVFLVGLSLPRLASAQPPAALTAPVNSFQNVPALYEQVFDPLDERHLSTGLLVDRAYPIFPMHNRTGQVAYDDSVATHADHFPFAVGMVEHMSERGAAAAPWLSHKFEDRIADDGEDEVLRLGALFFEADRIKTNAGVDRLLEVRGSPQQLHDVSGRRASPYYVERFFIVSSLSPVLSQRQTTVRLDADDWMSNLSGKVGLEIDLGAGFVPLSPGHPLSHRFAEAGERAIRCARQPVVGLT